MSERRYAFWRCQRCGEPIGVMGRAIDALTRPFGFVLHPCGPPPTSTGSKESETPGR